MRKKLLYYSIIFLRLIVQLLPRLIAIKFGAILGFVAYCVLNNYRKIAKTNLRRCFREKPNSYISYIARSTFINQGKNLVEVLKFSQLNSKNLNKIVKFNGIENLRNSFKKNTGVIILAAHFGNWELLGAALSLSGFPINVIARKVYIEEIENLLTGIRKSKGVKVISRGENASPISIIRALKKNEAIGILIDQNTKSVPGVYVDFLGYKAYTPSGIAILALKTNCVVIPGFIIRQKNNTHRIELLESIDIVSTGNIQSDIEQNTLKFNNIISSYIMKYPAQWVWFHNRWD